MVKRHTKRPVGHGCRAANELRILIHNVKGSRASEEVEIESAPNNAPREKTLPILDIHTITVKQKYAVREATSADVEIKRIRAVEINISVHGAYVGRPQRVRLALHERQAVWARALAQPEQSRARRHLGRELQVLVLEHEGIERVRRGRCGVEQNLPVRQTRHREPEWSRSVG